MRFHMGFSFNWKTLKKWIIPILIGILLLFSQKLSVFAYTSEGYIESGDSVKSTFSIGSQRIGANYNYFIDVNATNQSNLNGSFTMINDLPVATGQTANGYFHFALDHCKTGTNSTLSIYSSYYNYVDYSYNLGTSLYLAEGDYAKATCYRSFIRIRMEYYQNMPLNNGGVYVIYNLNNNFSTYNGNSYGILLRYVDLVYLSESDYNLLLESAKNGQANINIRNDINQIHGDLSDVKDSVDGVKDSVDGVKDAITDSNIATGSSASTYFGDNIWQQNYGLSSLINIPIDFIHNITSSTCNPITLNLPFVNQNITLPCISTIMQQNFQGLYDVYQLVIGGFIGLYCGLHIFKDIEDAINPFKDTPITQLFIG